MDTSIRISDELHLYGETVCSTNNKKMRLIDTLLKPLVSVIVPIYNVERFVSKCLDSLNGQSLKQIEVICIDDGSTDGSGKIADEYESQDWPIFRVIHTENFGLSAARNAGIKESQADWIMFVDSDDWVEPVFCSKAYLAAKHYNADLVAFRSRSWKNNRIVHSIKPKRLKVCVKTHFDQEKRPIGIVTKEVAIEYGGVVAWNKLYKRELFDNILFPQGRVFEDIATTYKLIHKAERIAMISDTLYNHVYRRTSISNTESVSNRRDGFIAALERYEFFCEQNYPISKYRTTLCSSSIGFLIMTTANAKDDEVVQWAESVLDSTKGLPKGLPTKRRLMLFAWRIDKRLFHILCRAFGKKSID